MIFVSGFTDERQHCLIGGSLCKGILDCGCTKTVSGEIWTDKYIQQLPEDWKKKEIEMKDSSTVHRFGDEKCAALHNVTAPV